MANQTPSLPTQTSTAAASRPPQKVDQQLQDVDLILVAESTTNPRQSRNPEADKELVESIRLHGVLQPVLVRRVIPTNKSGAFIYELVAGSRRFRAAKEAGLKTIPANIRTLTDEQALELQIIENLQREDIAPIEEGRGYTQLLAAMAKLDPKRAADGQGVKRQDLVVQIAQKVGKSPRYVYARMKLCELIPELQKDLLEGRIDASHADELVRLTPHDQKDIRSERLFFDEPVEDPKVDGQGISEWRRDLGQRVISIRNLKVVIEREYQLTLDQAKFDINDPNLKPVACVVCPKNTGFNPLLPATKKPTCTDKECWRNKMRQHVEALARDLGKKAPKKELVQITLAHRLNRDDNSVKVRDGWKSAKPGECKNVQPAVQVDVDDYGSGAKHFTIAKTVCLNKTCKKHWDTPAKSSSSSGSSHSSAPVKPQTLEELKKQNQGRLSNHVAEMRAIESVRRVVAKVDKLGETELRNIAADLAEQGYFNGDDLAAVLGRDKGIAATKLVATAKAAELPRILLALIFANDQIEDNITNAAFKTLAKAKGVNLENIEDELEDSIETCAICGCFEECGCELGGGKRCAWVMDDRLKKAGRICSNPLCIAEAKKKLGIKDAPAKKPAVQASAKVATGKPAKAKAAKGGRA